MKNLTFDELLQKYKQLAVLALSVADDMEAFKHLDEPELSEVKLFNEATEALALVEELTE